MSKKVIKVLKILIQLKKKEIELSLEEAHELQQILADLLGVEKKDNQITIIPSPPVVTIPYPVPYPVPSPFRRIVRRLPSPKEIL